MMLRGCLLWLLLSTGVQSAPLFDGLPEPTVTLDAIQASRQEVLRQIAQQAGYHVLVGPGLSGSVTVRGTLCLGQALRETVPPGWQLTVEQGYLIVSQPENPVNPATLAMLSLQRTLPIRCEILLERASAESLLGPLRRRYPRLTLRPHPTLNGFYVSGPRGEVAALKERLKALDVPTATGLHGAPGSPPPLTR